jgi:hypothetical protein
MGCREEAKHLGLGGRIVSLVLVEVEHFAGLWFVFCALWSQKRLLDVG